MSNCCYFWKRAAVNVATASGLYRYTLVRDGNQLAGGLYFRVFSIVSYVTFHISCLAVTVAIQLSMECDGVAFVYN